MRHTNQMNKGIRRTNGVRETVLPQSIPRKTFGSRRKSCLRSAADERPNLMSAPGQFGNQPAANVSGAASNKNVQSTSS